MTEPPPSAGRFIVDIRVFMLSMTIAMCASFMAGVTLGPSPPDLSVTMAVFKNPPPPLELSAEVVAHSLEHSPSGQHLLVDIANVEAAFLDSEERLTDAMVNTVNDTGLTMLSYHCHKLTPAGISCVGVLMESHISFHTWPDEGVITLDLFTCGPYPLLPNAVETMGRLFGIQRHPEEEVRVKWSHELRGFRPEGEKSNNAIDGYSDLSFMIHSPLDLYSKQQIYSNLTKFHRVDIWDVVEVR
jgi:S-adenosylmethionine decarboxylase proenzyme